MLRRSIAIAFLTLLFFNWYGYRLLSDFLQNRSDIQLEAKLDQNDYDASQLFEIRVPLNLPYHNDWQEFERYNGEIEVNGIHYKYVKRKVEKGEMVLLCLPNNEKQNLLSARDQFFKLVNDLQQNNSGKKSDQGSPNTIKTFNFEYRPENNDWAIGPLNPLKQAHTPENMTLVSRLFKLTPEQPPEFPG